jgi:hypothetical protein
MLNHLEADRSQNLWWHEKGRPKGVPSFEHQLVDCCDGAVSPADINEQWMSGSRIESRVAFWRICAL